MRDSTCRTVSPKKKRKREEVPDKVVLTPRSDENILQRAAQLKRRVCFLIIFKPLEEVRSFLLCYEPKLSKAIKHHNYLLIVSLGIISILYMYCTCTLRPSKTVRHRNYLVSLGVISILYLYCTCTLRPYVPLGITGLNNRHELC